MTLITYILPCLLLLCLQNLNAQEAYGKTYALVISGGIRPEANHYRYYDSTVKLHKAYMSAGVKKEDIFVLFGSGRSDIKDSRDAVKFSAEKNKTYFNAQAAFQKEHGVKISGGALKKDIKSIFEKLSKKMKAGDNLNLFITDHGSSNNAINLWGEELTVEELRSYIAILPKTVNIQIINNICYGGKVVDLTDNNVCVATAVDDKHVSAGEVNFSPFADYYADQISKGETFFQSYVYARNNDIPIGKYKTFAESKDGKPLTREFNVGATDSLKFFLAKQKNNQNKNICEKKENQNVTDTLLDSSKSMHKQHINSRSEVVKNNLKKQKAIFNDFMNNEYATKSAALSTIHQKTYRMSTASPELILKREKAYKDLNQKWDELIDKKLNLEKNIKNYTEELEWLNKENDFLGFADAEQLKKYEAIKNCLGRKI